VCEIKWEVRGILKPGWKYDYAKKLTGKGMSFKFTFAVISGIPNTKQMSTFCIIDAW
jgi:hypothetical protein